MSSYDDRRRRERSRDREERDRDRDGDLDRGRRGQGRDRRSRSRSPRRNDQSRRGGRDYGRDRHDDRRESGLNRDRDRRDDRRRDDRRDSNRDRDYDSRRKDDERRLNELSPHSSRNEHDFRRQADEKIQKEISHVPINVSPTNGELEKFFPDTTKEEGEDDDETMEIVNEGENAMMSMMGFGGFDSTKGKPVTGNQDGGANVKKPRTWRQYMNRRGGFNRPLDKIK